MDYNVCVIGCFLLFAILCVFVFVSMDVILVCIFEYFEICCICVPTRGGFFAVTLNIQTYSEAIYGFSEAIT